MIDLDHREREALAGAGIVIFEDRLILEARPPASEAALVHVAQHCEGELPPDLIALWQTAFGGTLDYDLRCDFEGHDAAFSFRELFYPESAGYHDLWGWIAHEEDLAREVAEKNGRPWSGVLDALPIGGFEYLDRIYVMTAPADHGSVWAWMKGLPPAWRFHLHRDSLARIATDVRALFRTLTLERDPWTAGPDDLGNGLQMRDAIERLASRSAADELRRLVRSCVLDWRAAIEDRTIAGRRALRRLAMEHAVRDDDLELLDRLVALGCDLAEEVRGGASPLDLALAAGRMRSARALIDRRVPVANALRSGAHNVDVDLARELIARGAGVDEHAVFAAVDAGRVEVAHVLVEELGGGPTTLRMAIRARERAHDADRRAARLESGKLTSNISAAEERARASRLRELADRIDPTLRAR